MSELTPMHILIVSKIAIRLDRAVNVVISGEDISLVAVEDSMVRYPALAVEGGWICAFETGVGTCKLVPHRDPKGRIVRDGDNAITIFPTPQKAICAALRAER